MLEVHARKRDPKAEEVKIVVVGDMGVGKTCICSQFCERVFYNNPQSTQGYGYFRKYVEIEGRTFLLNIWDTAGQEMYRSMLPMYFRGASVAILTYDITEKASFDNLLHWMRDVKAHTRDDTLFAVAGNKCDLAHVRKVSEDEPSKNQQDRSIVSVNGINIEFLNGRQVSPEAGSKFAEHYDAIFYETSAKTGKNVENLFYNIGQRLVQKLAEQPRHLPDKDVVKIHEPSTQKKQSGVLRKLFPCFFKQAVD